MPEPSHLPGSVRLRLRAILLFGAVFVEEDIHAAFAWAFAGKAQKLASAVEAGTGMAARPRQRTLLVGRVRVGLAGLFAGGVGMIRTWGVVNLAAGSGAGILRFFCYRCY